VVLVNPVLADVPSHSGVMGVRGRAERISFTESFEKAYHLRLLYFSGAARNTLHCRTSIRAMQLCTRKRASMVRMPLKPWRKSSYDGAGTWYPIVGCLRHSYGGKWQARLHAARTALAIACACIQNGRHAQYGAA
jgi:Domain of unknown function (DUF1995)